MNTVVQFIKNRSPGAGGRNQVFSRSLRKVAFIDNRFEGPVHPKPGEHWFVEIVRENQSENGGCFVLKPIHCIPKSSLSPLVHGMYDMHTDGDAIILRPKETGKFWVMSPTSKQLITWDGIRVVVIDHGGPMWQRRRPAASVMENEAKRLLESISDE